jgi:4-hydroxy-3-methylbut-2-enyl diphosphate reductase
MAKYLVEMKIIQASHLGMCFGVREAIDLAIQQAGKEKLTIFGELVHNQTVHETLLHHGVCVSRSVDAIETPTVLISSHGASRRARERLLARGHRLVEATCPLVQFAHRCLDGLVAAGYHPVLIGKRDHVEVVGMTEDLAEFDVVLSDEDAMQLQERPRLGIISQTTQPIERVHRLVALIRWRFPHSEVVFKETVCRPTRQRQTAAEKLARQCDAVVVIGAPHSNNTRELAATCRRFCTRIFPIQSAEELQPTWFTSTDTVGITAGTSTPDSVIAAVEQQLAAWAAPILTEP